MDLTQLALFEAADLIANQKVSPVELCNALLDRIARLDPVLNCFITLTAELAVEQARQAEVEISSGGYRGPLHGIPLALKDLFGTAGVRTTAGARFLADNIPQEDGFVVQKLKSAGAVFLGKLNMHEIALGVTTNNPHYGPCRNPWQPDRSPGGSSGGSGAALAAGLCLGSLGSDTGGSIRIPAALCGVVGLKPTYGRVSLRGVIPLSWNLDHAGPLARRVRDVAILLQTIAGYDPADPASVDVLGDDYLAELEAGIKGWKIAIATDEFFSKAGGEVLAAIERAGQVFADSGAHIEEVEIQGGYQAALNNGLMTTSDAAAYHRERLESSPDDFGEDILQRLQLGASYTSTEYILARRLQSHLRRQFELFFHDFDVLLTATTPIPAPPIEGQDALAQARTLTRFTAPFNFTGLPALSLPCGLTGSGLPIGLQLVGPPWSEARLLRAAFAYERSTGPLTIQLGLDKPE
jgi:aspartyl-tRNA(Asn)/glutamyl-tRNA(Gln) amidotransferase subunit A